MTETIQQLKEDIAVLQEKLQKLEEIEKQPRMNLQQEGEYAVVSYHDKVYYRLEGEVTFSWYIKKGVSVGYPVPTLMMVNDAETERLLEGLYYNYIQVKKEKEQQIKELVRESVKWCEEHQNESVEDYLKPQTPEKTEKSLKEAFVKAQQTEEWKETQRKIDAPKESWMNKSDEELIAILEKNPPDCLKFVMGKTLEQIIERWWCDTFTGTHEKWSMEECIDDLIDQIELFLPRSQSSEGTQNIDTVVAVEAHNELLQKIKSKLRNKK